MSHYGQNGGRSILVLYRIVNSESDGADPFYNCFSMPYGSGPTLNAIKQNCAATHSLSHLGPEGYHWRVMVEDKPGSASGGGGGAERTFSWWDIQDGNAKLPVKETSQYDLRKLLFPSKATSADSATKAAKGAFKMMGKAMASAIGDDSGMEGQNHGPPVSVLVVKLLDLVKLHDEYNLKHGGGHAAPAPQPRRTAPRPPAASSRPSSQKQPQQQRQQQSARPPTASQPPRRTPQPQPPAKGGDLMDFGAPAAAAAPKSGGGTYNNPKTLHHSSSSPASVNPNETRAQRLKREQEARMKKSNRVWDDIDQRWVEVDPKAAATAASTSRNNSMSADLASAFGAPKPAASKHHLSASAPPQRKEIGIKLDMNSAAGKEAQKNMDKAVAELKEREAEEKKRQEEEDKIRQQLEPKIKAWSEEHGKKKQLQALLGSLHTILWQGAKWKQISIGDVLDASKCKKFYFKATLVVHPDKTHDLPAEQRFLAKRIFDALSQAKTIWDQQQNGGR